MEVGGGGWGGGEEKINGVIKSFRLFEIKFKLTLIRKLVTLVN